MGSGAAGWTPAAQEDQLFLMVSLMVSISNVGLGLNNYISSERVEGESRGEEPIQTG